MMATKQHPLNRKMIVVVLVLIDCDLFLIHYELMNNHYHYDSLHHYLDWFYSIRKHVGEGHQMVHYASWLAGLAALLLHLCGAL